MCARMSRGCGAMQLKRAARRVAIGHRARQGIERLEERTLLAALPWTGMGDGTSWGDPLNWLGGRLPANGDDVTIYASSQPVRLTAGSYTISTLNSSRPFEISGGSLTVSGGNVSDLTGSFTMSGGTLFVGAWGSFAADGAATITGGTVSVMGTDATFAAKNATAITNATLTADSGATATFAAATTLMGVSMAATNGGKLLFPAATSYYGSTAANETITASGTGSRIDLSHLGLFAGGGQDPKTMQIYTTAMSIRTGGEVDLAGVVSSNAPSNQANQWNTISVDMGSTLGVAGVTKLSGTILTTASSISFAAVTELLEDDLSASAATVSFVAATRLTDVSIWAGSGAKVHLPVATSYTGSNVRDTTIQATDTGSLIDFPAMQTFLGGGNDGPTVYRTYIRAVSGGEIDLAGYVGGNGNGGNAIFVDPASMLGVGSITSLRATGLDAQRNLSFWNTASLAGCGITADGTTITFPVATTLSAVNLVAGNEGEIAFPVASSYAGYDHGDTVIYALGTGSRIDLSHLQSLAGGGQDEQGDYVTRISTEDTRTGTSGGEVDLAGKISSRIAPHIGVVIDAMDPIGLLAIAGVTGLDGTELQSCVSFTFPQVTSLSDSEIIGVGGSAVIQFPAVATLDGTSLKASAGSHIVLSAATYFFGYDLDDTYITADGTSSIVSLPNLQLMNGGGVDTSVNPPRLLANRVSAMSGGWVDTGGAWARRSGIGNVVKVDATSHLTVSKVTSLDGTSVQTAIPLSFVTATSLTNDSIKTEGAIVQFPQVTTIAASSLSTAAGGQILFPQATTYTSLNQPGVISAEGSGSLIQLSALKTLLGGGVNPTDPTKLYTLGISAKLGGEVDLAGDISGYGAAGIGVRIAVDVDADSMLNVSGVTSLGDTVLTSGRPLSFDLATAVFDDNITSSGGAFVFSSAATIANTQLYANNGGQILFPAATSYTASNTVDTNIQASGAGSRIELARLLTFAGGGQDPVTPTKRYATFVKATGGSEVDLGGSVGLSTPSAKPNEFQIESGVLNLDGLRALDHSNVNLSNTTVYLAGTVSLTNSTINLGDGTTLVAADGSTVSAISTTINASGSGSSMRNRGLLNISGFVLNLPGLGLTNESGGEIFGTGTIHGDLTNSGTVSPGSLPTGAAGILAVNGDFTQTPDATLRIELAGTFAGTLYDQLSVSGNAVLSGSEDVHYLNGYMPAVSTVYTTLVASPITGSFDAIDGGVALTASYSATAHNLTAVPMPADTTPPVVSSWSAVGVPVDGSTTIDFTITYSDNFAVLLSSIGSTDVTVSGGNAPFTQVASLVGVNRNSDGTPRKATYRINNPAGFNGTYTIVLSAGAVTDIAGNPIAGGTLGQITTVAGTTTELDVSATTVTYGSPVILTATVSSLKGTPGGTVRFLDGVTVVGTATLNAGGVATLTSSDLNGGYHTLVARYSGAPGYGISASVGKGLTVQSAGSSTALSSSNSAATFGQIVRFSVIVSPVAGTAVPTGTVQFVVDGVNLGAAVDLVDGAAMSTSLSSLAAGDHSIAAIYSGDRNYTTSTKAITQTVRQSTTATTVTASIQPSVYGQSVTLTATVVPGSGGSMPTGMVQFQLDGADFGAPVTLANGSVASSATSTLSVGLHGVSARYLGDSNYSASQGSANQTVTAAATTTTLTVSQGTIVYGDTVTFTAQVSANAPGGGVPNGQVQFQIDGTDVGSPVSLAADGKAGYTTSTLLAGNHTVGARYIGVANFSGSSTSVSRSVSQATLTVTGITAGSKTYDGTVAAIVSAGGAVLAGVLAGDAGSVTLVTSAATGAFDAKAAGSGIGVTVNGLSLSGVRASNYALGVVRTSADILAKALSATIVVASKVYDGTTAATITSRTLVGAISGDVVTCTGGSAQFADAHAGSAKTVSVTGLALTGADAGNYTFSASASTTADITKAPTATGVSASSTRTKPGDPVTFTAIVTATPSVGGQGTVQFRIDGSPIGSPVALTGVWATYSTTALTSGIHLLSAVYIGTADFAGSTSFASTQYVESAPNGIALTPSSIAENQPAGSTVGTLTATDPDAGDTAVFALVSGTGSDDNALFTVAGNQLHCVTTLNYEQKNGYSVRIRATDSTGLSFEKVFTIAVTNVNEAPTVSSFTQTLDEGTTAVVGVDRAGIFADPEGDALAAVKIVSLPTHGVTRLAGVAVSANQVIPPAQFGLLTYTPDADYAGSDSAIWTASDGQLFAQTPASIAFVVQPVNDAPTGIALSSTSVAENQPAGALVGNLSATDPDSGDTATFALVSGAGAEGNSAFTVSGNQLRTAAILDYEAQRTYSIRVRVTDSGGLAFEKTFSIGVTNAVEIPAPWVIDGTDGTDVITLDQSGLEYVLSVNGMQSTMPADLVTTITVNGLAGDDTASVTSLITKGVLINGGDGNDTITGGIGPDTLNGQLGDDLLYGQAGADFLVGGGGGDTLYGGGGRDNLSGGNGLDLIYGQGGADYISGGSKADSIYGGSGSDTISGGVGADLIYGGAGDDWIYVNDGSALPDTVVAGNGTDHVAHDPADSILNSYVSIPL